MDPETRRVVETAILHNGMRVARHERGAGPAILVVLHIYGFATWAEAMAAGWVVQAYPDAKRG
jgi:hypothetical protein